MAATQSVSLLRQAVKKFKRISTSHRDHEIECTFCQFRVRHRDWSQHLKTRHKINCRVACPYCCGAFRWRHGEGQKRLDVAQHRVACIEKFFSRKSVASTAQSVDSTASTAESVVSTSDTNTRVPPSACSCVDFLVRDHPPDLRGRQVADASLLVPYGNSSVFEATVLPDDDEALRVKFTEQSGLGSGVYNAFYYFFGGEYQFFHVMVRAELWTTFSCFPFAVPLNVLPWWCLCDGSHSSERRDIHRHMIFMVKKTDVQVFKKEWKTCTSRTPQHQGPQQQAPTRNKLCIPITNPEHLMNALFYVSNYASSCDGRLVIADTTDDSTDSSLGSHFWLAREMYPHAKIAMGCLWRSGHQKYVATRLRHVSMDPCFDRVRDNPMRVPLRYLALPCSHCAVPFSEELAVPSDPVFVRCEGEFPKCEFPTRGVPIVFFYGRSFELVRVPFGDRLKLLPHTATQWFDFQMRSNNVFWKCCEDECYELSRSQIKEMRGHRRVLEKSSLELRAVVARLSDELRTAQAKIRDLELTNEQLQTAQARIRELEHEVAELNRYITTFSSESRMQLLEARQKCKRLEVELRKVREKLQQEQETRQNDTKTLQINITNTNN